MPSDDPTAPDAGASDAPHAADAPPTQDGDDAASEMSGGPAGPQLPGALRRAWPWLRWPLAGAAALLVLVVGVVAWVWTTTELPPTPEVDQSAVLLDASGAELAVLAQEGLRLEVPLEEIDPVAVDALLAAEDQRFYDHTGIDPAGIARALWNNLRDDSTQGGSTITQQLVKNVYLTSERTLTRKVREAVLAVKLERTEDKEVILERYLNTVYFGRGAYGVEAAARAFFDGSAAELAPEQAALLMGMLRAPEKLDPAEHPDEAKVRRDAVLAAMVETGALTQGEAQRAARTPVEVTASEPTPTVLRAGVAPHFVEHVRAQLVRRFGEQALYDRGLVVHTTLDIVDQRAAEAAVAANLDDPGDPQAAVVGVDRSGAVRAWVGGRDFEALQVDLVTGGGGSGRQPGSTFKPVALAAHLAAGGGAGERYPAPSEISLDIGGDEPWEVENSGGSSYGSLTLAEATARSVNTVYAQVVLDVGGAAVVDMAHQLGVQRPLEPHPSIALGAQEVSPIEMAAVYSTLARSGERVFPYTISQIVDRDGDVLWQHEAEAEQAIEPEVAHAVSAVLEETPRRGTARRAALERPMAAKTGTTQRNADAWLAGYTPEYTAIVWVGNPTGNEPIEPVDGQVVQGGTVPAQIWHDFMVEAVADAPPTPFPQPDPELLGAPGRRRTASQASTRDDDDRERRTTTTRSAPSTTSTTEAEDEEPGDDASEDDGADATTTTTTAPGATTTTRPTTTTTRPPATTAPTTTAPPDQEATASAESADGGTG